MLGSGARIVRNGGFSSLSTLPLPEVSTREKYDGESQIVHIVELTAPLSLYVFEPFFIHFRGVVDFTTNQIQTSENAKTLQRNKT